MHRGSNRGGAGQAEIRSEAEGGEKSPPSPFYFKESKNLRIYDTKLNQLQCR